MKKILAFLAFFALFCTIQAAAAEDNPVLRVGLYYDTDAMATANLQVTNGSGYRLGFFDSKRTFISLYSVSAQKITMARDQNLWYENGTFYQSGAPQGARRLGAYHIECVTKFSSLSDAQKTLAGFTAKGISGFPAYINGSFCVRLGAYSSLEEANAAQAKIGGTVVGNSKTAVTVYQTDTGTILFEYDGGTSSSLAVNPTQGEVSMPLSWFKGMKFPGAFEYIRNGGNITVVNVVPMQDYLKGVLPWEMYPTDPLEALKAQALCARTYAYYHRGKHGKEFDICAGTHCQAYRGMERASETTNRAVDETLGQYILYNGAPINAVFHSCDGGATEDAKNVWGSEIPYLIGKVDPYEDLEHALNGIWSYTYTPQELTDILNAKGYQAALIRDAYVAQYTPLGNVLRVVFVDANGKEWVFERERARLIINSSTLKKYTRSQRFKITKNGGGTAAGTIGVNGVGELDLSGGYWAVGASGAAQQSGSGPVAIITANGTITASGAQSTGDGNFVISGTGWGHNVGMSQEGAAGMAKRGMTAEQIIHFYYTNVTISGR